MLGNTADGLDVIFTEGAAVPLEYVPESVKFHPGTKLSPASCTPFELASLNGLAVIVPNCMLPKFFVTTVLDPIDIPVITFGEVCAHPVMSDSVTVYVPEIN